jgi:pectate lyase
MLPFRPLLLALALAVPATFAHANGNAPMALCNEGRNDSVPSSLGADGWAAVDGPVTGGCGAMPSRIHHVHNRAQLVAALTRGGSDAPTSVQGRPRLDEQPKIVYVHGTLDLNVDDANRPLTEEDYMLQCGWTQHATYYDPVTGDQTGAGGFFGDYKAAYDPNLWIRQSLDPADNRPPALSGPLEEARLCFQRKQAERVVIDVGSNTSIIGAGTDARIVNGNLRLGYVNQDNPNDPKQYAATNIVIRNITFADAFDMFSSWDPKDSFSVTITNTNGCQAIYDPATDSGPHRCPTVRGGRWNAEYDSVSVMNAERVWIDHNTFTDEPRTDKLFPPVFAAPFNEATQKVQHHDGQVDVTLLGTKVTVSNNVFRTHDKTNLLGGSDFAGLVDGYGPGRIDVTFHGNHFLDTVQRMPRVRFGRVHVYNNYYQVDRNAAADYRLGDAWILGTASKLVTEHNLFDIRNNSLTIPRIINYSSNLANRQLCIDAGFTPAQCGTYYRDQGTIVMMIRTTVTPNTTATTVHDAFAAVKAIQESSASNAPLLMLDPTDPGVFWLPSHSYSYAAMPIDGAAQQEMLRQRVTGSAGAGKF